MNQPACELKAQEISVRFLLCHPNNFSNFLKKLNFFPKSTSLFHLHCHYPKAPLNTCLGNCKGVQTGTWFSIFHCSNLLLIFNCIIKVSFLKCKHHLSISIRKCQVASSCIWDNLNSLLGLQVCILCFLVSFYLLTGFPAWSVFLTNDCFSNRYNLVEFPKGNL